MRGSNTNWKWERVQCPDCKGVGALLNPKFRLGAPTGEGRPPQERIVCRRCKGYGTIGQRVQVRF